MECAADGFAYGEWQRVGWMDAEATSSPNSSCSALQDQIAFGGTNQSNLQVIRMINMSACCAACDSLPACLGWTYDRKVSGGKVSHAAQQFALSQQGALALAARRSLGTCWLKANLVPVRSHRAVSGAKPLPAACAPWPQGPCAPTRREFRSSVLVTDHRPVVRSRIGHRVCSR